MSNKQMQLYQRDHFRDKINRKIDPLIEKEELLLKSTISELTEKIESNLAKKIGADKVIDQLHQAELEVERARRKAVQFFEFTARKKKIYSVNKNWYDDDDKKNINVDFCLKQINKWATALAEEEAEKTEMGKKLTFLRETKEKMKDDVMECNVSDDLKKLLSESLTSVGVKWNATPKALINKK